MNNLIFVAGAAALAIANPAIAGPGHGHGNKGNAHARTTQGKAHGHGIRGNAVVTTRNGGRLYAFDARGSCPPGLAKRNNGCLPPGQARKVYSVGQRYNRNFGNRWSYAQIPYDMRSRYALDRTGRFYYRNGYLYQVDPRTMLVQKLVSAILR